MVHLGRISYAIHPKRSIWMHPGCTTGYGSGSQPGPISPDTHLYVLPSTLVFIPRRLPKSQGTLIFFIHTTFLISPLQCEQESLKKSFTRRNKKWCCFCHCFVNLTHKPLPSTFSSWSLSYYASDMKF